MLFLSQLFVFILTILLITGDALGQEPSETSALLPALTQSELKSRLETLKSVYPDWYERVSDGAVHRKASFAAKLLKDAQGTDPSSDGFYPMLWESMRFSRSGLDCETGFSAIDLLSSHYDVNAPKLKLVLLEGFGDSSVPAREVKKTVDFVLPAIQQAVDRNDYEVALSLKEAGDVLASKVFSKSLQKDLAQAKETLDLLQGQYEDYQASLALLERNDLDENANLVLAQYLGLRQGKWEEAESYANKVGDENVRGLFVREVLEPEEATDRLSLADDWWDYSERVSGAAKQQSVEVAIGHYESAMKGLSGFDAKKAEMRVAEKKEPLINVRASKSQLLSGEPTWLNEGLLAFYPFNGNAKDESGNGHDGEVRGAELAVDRYGVADQAYRFDGVDDYINCPTIFNKYNPLTLTAWIKFDKPKPNEYLMAIVGKQRSARGSGFCWSIVRSSHKMAANFYDTSIVKKDKFRRGESPEPIPSAKWNFVSYTNDGVNQRLFLSGLLVKQFKSNQHRDVNNANLFIGREILTYQVNKRSYRGMIDDVRIYNRALSPEEVKSLYEFEKPR